MTAMNQALAIPLAPPRLPRLQRALAWSRSHLFPSPGHSLLTLSVLALLCWCIPAALNWLVFDATFVGSSAKDCNPGGACWLPITQRWNLFVYGFYPQAEQWRVSLALVLAFGSAQAAPQAEWLEHAKKEQQPYLDTLRDLVHIESGSKDVAGVKKIAEYIAGKLRAQGGKVEVIEPSDIYRLDDTPEKVGPMVHAEFKGKGSSRIMLIAHMDTVYLPGMLKDQPFRIDGDKAYGLGIADDKQGVALIMHIVPLLKKLGIEDYGTLTVLINGDEEISSPGARSTITRLGAEQDAVFSFEGGGTDGSLRLATSGTKHRKPNQRGNIAAPQPIPRIRRSTRRGAPPTGAHGVRTLQRIFHAPAHQHARRPQARSHGIGGRAARHINRILHRQHRTTAA